MNQQVIVDSVLMRPAITGILIEGLRQKMANRLNGDMTLLQKLDLVIVRTLGCTVEDASEISYDYNWAKNSTKCYSSESISRTGYNTIPVGVSEVRFRADLNCIAGQPHGFIFLQTTSQIYRPAYTHNM